MPRDTVDPVKHAMLAQSLRWLVGKILAHPTTTLLASVLIALGATLYSAAVLRFKTDRGDLLSPDSSFNQHWIVFEREFDPADDLVYVVTGQDTALVTATLDRIAAELAAQPDQFSHLYYKIDLPGLMRKGCYYLSAEELQTILDQLDLLGPILAGNWGLLNLPNLLQGFRHQMDRSAGALRSEVQRLLVREIAVWGESLASYIAAPTNYHSPWTQLRNQFRSESLAEGLTNTNRYLLTNEGKMGFVQARPKRDPGSFLGMSESISSARAIAQEVRRHHPEVEVGLTGLPVLEDDEMRASQRSMAQASVLSFGGVSLLFILGFRGVRHPMLAVTALLVGLAWSVGFVTLTIGHLNILSVSFSVILIGLGIDFGIHFLARYLDERRAGQGLRAALENTTGRVGPGIVTAAITTALAFFSAGLTEFLGIAELGIIAGAGVLLCMVAALVVLPALIVLSDRNRETITSSLPRGITPIYRLWLKYPAVWITVFLLGTLFLGSFAADVRYDHNLLNLQAEGLESVQWEKRIINDSDRSVWCAISVADSHEQARQRSKEFEALPSVSLVNDISQLIPLDQDRKQGLIAAIRQRLDRLPQRQPARPSADPLRVGRQIELLVEAFGETKMPEALAAVSALKTAQETLASLSPVDQYARLTGYQDTIAKDLLFQLHELSARADPDPVTVADLPENLAQRFVSPGGKWMLQVYADRNVWEFEPLKQFVSEVRSIDPQVTGKPLLAYEASLQMKASYEEAALYALGAIVFVLLLDFRRLDDTILALLPVAIGMLLLFGVLGLFQIDLNPANMIVLPLIIGIGVDDGVHVLHDFRAQRGSYWLSSSTARAIVLTSLTTIIGFGSLMISDHQGIRSLGVVLSLGVACCLATSVVLLPAVLSWISRPGTSDEESRHPEETSAGQKGDFPRRS